MNPPQQSEYFLIEVNDLEILEEVLKDSMQLRILARTRTRPHTPAPELRLIKTEELVAELIRRNGDFWVSAGCGR